MKKKTQDVKEQLPLSVEAKGCGVRHIYTGIYSYIFPASAGISHDPITYDFYIFYNGANNAKCTQHRSFPTLSSFSSQTSTNETSTRSSSKATVVSCTPLAQHARQHNSRQSPTTQREGVSEAARCCVPESRGQQAVVETVLFRGSREYFAQLCSEEKCSLK